MRELTPTEIEELLASQAVGRIGCHAGGVTYVVPIIYAVSEGSVYVASIEGRKVCMMRENPQVCFEVDEYDGAGSWRSVIAQGRYEELGETESQEALALLARRFSRGDEDSPPRRRAPAEDRPTVCFRIRLADVSGRAAPGSAP